MPEITKPEDRRLLPADCLVWLLLAAAGIAAYFAGLSLPLAGPDEPRYAQIAREMFERGDWITPTLGGYQWFEKPALLYWLQIVSYKIFGVSEFAARFGSAVFGLGTVFALWILGKAVQSAKRKPQSSSGKAQTSKINSSFILHPSSFAHWLALISASSLGLIAFSHAASFDIILTFPLTAALVGFFVYGLSSGRSSPVFNFSLFVFYFFTGVALIAKGLVGAVFPAAIVVFYYVLRRKLPTRSFTLSLIWGVPVILLVASAWYAPMYRANGWKFIDEFFIQHHFQRYTSNKYQHPQPFYFFFWVLPLMTLPWLPLFLASLWNVLKVQSSKFKVRSSFDAVQDSKIKDQNSKIEIQDSKTELTTFSVAWLLVPLVFFSVSGSKLPGYILPALPAALILTADYASRLAEKSRNWKILLQSAAFAVFAGTILAAWFFAGSFIENHTTKNLLATAAARGFADADILNLHTVSHNAEFYGAGRVARDMDGKIRQFYGVEEIAEQIARGGGKPVLVIVSPEYVWQLTSNALVNSQFLAGNEDQALYAVSLRKS